MEATKRTTRNAVMTKTSIWQFWMNRLDRGDGIL